MAGRVFVHIGRNKTGTSAIQYALSEGRAALEREGFVMVSSPTASTRRISRSSRLISRRKFAASPPRCVPSWRRSTTM